MKLALAAFTDRGESLGLRLITFLGETGCEGVFRPSAGGESLKAWTGRQFEEADALVFIGAAGIAVRSIAPCLVRKDCDPAVLVIDEKGRFVIPLLSGHIGGANELAEKIAGRLDACAVITTATDINGVFAIDVWAKKQGCCLPDISGIKKVSGKLLGSETVFFDSEFPITGRAPCGVVRSSGEKKPDFCLTIHQGGTNALILVPRIISLGIGCKRGTPCENIERLFERVFREHHLLEEAVLSVSTVDIKASEEGLLAFCRKRGLKLKTYSAGELSKAEGRFHGSSFVEKTIGVDNVCERSAVMTGGKLLIEKTSGDGVTLAAALVPYHPAWPAE